MTADRNPNVVTALQKIVARIPDRLALVIDRGGREETVTFARLWDRADRVSTGLLRVGFKPGERAILMVPLSVDLYAVLIGVLKLGGVAVFVSPWLSPRHIASSADFAAPDIYIGSPKSQLLRFRHARLREIPLSVTTGGRLWRIPAGLSLRQIESAPGDGKVYPVHERIERRTEGRQQDARDTDRPAAGTRRGVPASRRRRGHDDVPGLRAEQPRQRRHFRRASDELR